MRPWVSFDGKTTIHYRGEPADNQCCRCGEQWRDGPGGFASIKACPACGSLYWRWLNYAGKGKPR